jgi:hypothetical protein
MLQKDIPFLAGKTDQSRGYIDHLVLGNLDGSKAASGDFQAGVSLPSIDHLIEIGRIQPRGRAVFL